MSISKESTERNATVGSTSRTTVLARFCNLKMTAPYFSARSDGRVYLAIFPWSSRTAAPSTPEKCTRDNGQEIQRISSWPGCVVILFSASSLSDIEESSHEIDFCDDFLKKRLSVKGPIPMKDDGCGQQNSFSAKEVAFCQRPPNNPSLSSLLQPKSTLAKPGKSSRAKVLFGGGPQLLETRKDENSEKGQCFAAKFDNTAVCFSDSGNKGARVPGTRTRPARCEDPDRWILNNFNKKNNTKNGCCVCHCSDPERECRYSGPCRQWQDKFRFPFLQNLFWMHVQPRLCRRLFPPLRWTRTRRASSAESHWIWDFLLLRWKLPTG